MFFVINPVEIEELHLSHRNLRALFYYFIKKHHSHTKESLGRRSPIGTDAYGSIVLKLLLAPPCEKATSIFMKYHTKLCFKTICLAAVASNHKTLVPIIKLICNFDT